MRIHLPQFFIPDNVHILTTPEEIAQHSHSWELCTACGYVLCSCGNCHNSLQCNEPCGYDQESEKKND